MLPMNQGFNAHDVGFSTLCLLCFSDGVVAWLTQSSINSLQKRRYSVDGGYTFAAVLVGLRWGRGISAVDNHSYDTYTAFVDWDFAPRWTVSIDAGLADSYESDQATFAGAGVRWQF